jgi:uncharacterized lipoprotein NlpE involved in copper resistance
MKKSLLAIALLSILLVACNKHENKADTTSEASTPAQTTEANNNAVDTAHTAENSLDWDGKYKGTLPCADCEGIKTELELKDDKTYELTETYLGKGDATHLKPMVSLLSTKTILVITLDDKAQNRKFFIGENTATALDMEGKKVEGSLAEHYVLKKLIYFSI